MPASSAPYLLFPPMCSVLSEGWPVRAEATCLATCGRHTIQQTTFMNTTTWTQSMLPQGSGRMHVLCLCFDWDTVEISRHSMRITIFWNPAWDSHFWLTYSGWHVFPLLMMKTYTSDICLMLSLAWHQIWLPILFCFTQNCTDPWRCWLSNSKSVLLETLHGARRTGLEAVSKPCWHGCSIDT